MINVRIQKAHPDAIIPKYMSSGAAGCDVNACLHKPLVIEPGSRFAVPTGLVFEVPEGYELQVRPRSGLAFKKGLTVVNAPGTVDSDFRGEVKVLLVNLGEETVVIEPGDRIAQLVLNQVDQMRFEQVSSLSETERGVGGFGSTGISEPEVDPSTEVHCPV